MDPRYRRIYELLYAGFVDSPDDVTTYNFWQSPEGAGDPGRRAIERAIDQADREISPRSLREDAKALLALNFYNLVFIPLRAGGQVDEATIERDVGEDIPMLARAAAGASDEAEVSAHEVLDALSSNWSDLQTGRHRLWQEEP